MYASSPLPWALTTWFAHAAFFFPSRSRVPSQGAWAILAAGAYILGTRLLIGLMTLKLTLFSTANEILGVAVAWNPAYVLTPPDLVGVYLGILALAFLCNVSFMRPR